MKKTLIACNAKKAKQMNTLTCLNLISHENKILPNRHVGSYHSGNGKKPNTRQPASSV